MKVSLMVFLDTHGDILLNKRRNSKNEEMWDLVGGGIEDGETPIQAIIREMKEELSLTIDASEIKLLGHRHIETEKYTADVTFFTAKAPNLSSLKSSDEVFVEDLMLMPIAVAETKRLLPMTKLLFEEKLLNNNPL